MLKFSHVPSNKILVLAPIGVLTLVAAVGFSLVTAQRVQAGVDDKEVKDVIQTAFNPSVTFGKVEHFAGSAKLAPSADLKSKLSDNDVQSARDHAHLVMSSVFSPKCAVCKQLAQGVEDGLTAESKGVFRIVDGGQKSVEWRQVNINGNTASVTVAATHWIKTVSTNEFGQTEVQTPQDGKVKVFTLEKANGHWVITNVLTDQPASDAMPINRRPAAAAAKGADIPAKSPVSNPQGSVKDPNVSKQ